MVRGSWRKKFGLGLLISASRPSYVLPKFTLLFLADFSHSERKASAAICLTLGICARGQDTGGDTPMSNPGSIEKKEKAPLYKEGPFLSELT